MGENLDLFSPTTNQSTLSLSTSLSHAPSTTTTITAAITSVTATVLHLRYGTIAIRLQQQLGPLSPSYGPAAAGGGCSFNFGLGSLLLLHHHFPQWPKIHASFTIRRQFRLQKQR